MEVDEILEKYHQKPMIKALNKLKDHPRNELR